MNGKFLETGEIVNTHGIRGEVKILPWANSPEFLREFEVLYIDGAPRKVLSARVHKDCVIALLEGVVDIDAAIKLKRKIVSIARADVDLDEGEYFLADIVGLDAIDAATGESLGKVYEVLTLPKNNVYVIRGAREILVPAVSEFVIEVNPEGGYIKLRLIEGM